MMFHLLKDEMGYKNSMKVLTRKKVHDCWVESLSSIPFRKKKDDRKEIYILDGRHDLKEFSSRNKCLLTS